MPLILCIESSAKNCSVAVVSNGLVVALREVISDGYTHAENLHLFIEEVLKKADIRASELQAVAVSKGPGSFTGLRIGISSAKGLCAALNIPLIAYSVPEVLAPVAFVKYPHAAAAVAMIDARRMEVYTACFNPDMSVRKPIRAEVVDPSFFDAIPVPTVFVGDGVDKCANMIQTGHVLWPVAPSAAMGAVLAEMKFVRGEFEDVASFEPYYLKDFVAGVRKG